MKFAGLIKQSLVDYPGKVAAVLFTRGCNLRCTFCHNGHLLVKPGKADNQDLDIEDILAFLQERMGFLDGVVISGGEPCLEPDLPEACRQLKSIGCLVKLDTNGSRPTVIEDLIRTNLVDYVAMDIKAPLEYKPYQAACGGRLSPEDFFNIRNSVHLLRQAPIPVEFRTTVVPLLHQPQDLEAIARSIAGARLYSLQQFNPRQTLDPGLGTVKPYTLQELQDMAEACRSHVNDVRILNA